ncbi:acyl-homoserine-lactone synthase [Thalassomonas sp. RHCl1]|uniref:acyl-homoserine-lactone synthase n=1 Tax=Thalassomonas sp. RHCl1 TaxID=2995320 RepID=UPI00248A9532|nr:acyl-homoserine-lactone synthase [Thalassomonas sp. RHCl1]
MENNIFMQENGFDLAVSKKHKLLIDCYKLRHDVFAKELEWVAEEDNRLEIDKFDFASNHIVISQNQKVNAYMRVTPKHSPWLLTDTFSFLINEGRDHEFLDNSVEVTRLAVDAQFRKLKIHQQFTLCDMLIKGLLQFSLENNIKHWYIVVSQEIFSLLNRRGLDCQQLGKTTVMPDGVRTLAARIDVETFIENCAAYYLDFNMQEQEQQLAA